MLPITVAPGVEIDADALKRVAGMFQLPGEHVRLNPDQKFIGEDAAALDARRTFFGDRVLVVAETRVDPCTDGAGHLINYVLEGVAGRHNAKAFMGPQGFEHLYGMLVTRAGETWFVPFDGDKDPAEVSGPARRIDTTEMPRSLCYAFGLADPTLGPGMSAAEFFAEHEASPSMGEYVLAPNGDAWVLEYSPWMSGASPAEIAAAEAAIAAATAPAAA